jgi:glycosyltransferase involved in cell wall biosynthesis
MLDRFSAERCQVLLDPGRTTGGDRLTEALPLLGGQGKGQALPALQPALAVGRDKGDGSLLATKDLAGRLGVAARVSFPGGVAKAAVRDWLNRGDIFLNTTDVDNTPVSVLEAMACGLPVVSTNVGGIPYLLNSEEDSLLVPPNDPEAMAGAVGRILRESGLARRLSRNARARAEASSWPVVLPRWRALIEEAANRSRETPLRMEP